MGLGAENLRHDHAIKTFAQRRELFDFQTDRGQRRGQFVAARVGLYVLAQPVF